jgi:hypothetical protein
MPNHRISNVSAWYPPMPTAHSAGTMYYIIAGTVVFYFESLDELMQWSNTLGTQVLALHHELHPPSEATE